MLRDVRAMQTRLYFILLATGVCAAPHASGAAELLALLEQICNSVTEDAQNLRIETPLHTENANCVNKIFEGMELLKNNLDMKKFGVFFQKFEKLKQSLTPHLGAEEECDTERKNPKHFIEKLTTFIRKSSRNPRVRSY